MACKEIVIAKKLLLNHKQFLNQNKLKRDKSQYDYIMENLKQSVLQYSKKSSIKARFSIKKAPDKKAVSSSSAHIATTTVSNKSSAQSDTNNGVDKMVSSVLDLFPDMQKDFIKVCIIKYEIFLRDFLE